MRNSAEYEYLTLGVLYFSESPSPSPIFGRGHGDQDLGTEVLVIGPGQIILSRDENFGPPFYRTALVVSNSTLPCILTLLPKVCQFPSS